jgi:hypothetical protein
MKQFLAIFYLIALTLSPALAQNRVVDGDIFPGIGHTKNYILNGEIEKNDNNITDASGIASRSTVTPLSGAASLLIDGTANAQRIIFTASTREPALYGQNCSASFTYSGDASLYTASIEQGGVTVSGTTTNLTNAGTSSETESITFACGVAATGANTLVLTCTAAGCAAIKVDKVYMGLPTGSGGGAGSSVMYTETFTGDGSDTTFVLSNDPGTEDNTNIYIDGIYQQKNLYSISGTTITFTDAPSLSASIEVHYGSSTAVTVGDPDLAPNRRTVAGNTSQVVTDDEIYVTATATITLLPANTTGVRPVTIIVAASGITVTITGTHLIKGETSIEMDSEHDAATFFPDGTSKWNYK